MSPNLNMVDLPAHGFTVNNFADIPSTDDMTISKDSQASTGRIVL